MWTKAGTPAELAELDSAMSNSLAWIAKVKELTDGLQFDTSNRNRVAVSLFHLCIEHQYAIHLLVRAENIGSAFALVRPQIEAYVRGAWYLTCATDAQVELFIKDEEPPSPGIMIKALEATPSFSSGSLSRLKRDVWDNLCGFTHGGSIQMKARVTKDEIRQNFKLPRVSGLVTASTSISLLACVGLATAVNDTPLANKIHNTYKEIYSS